MNPKLRFKDQDGNAFPDWEEKKIKEIGEVCSGGTPNTNEPKFWNGEIQWFTPSEVGKDKYVYNSLRTISASGLKKSSACILPINTLLVSTRATLGEISIAKKECSTNQGFHPIIVNNDNDNEFIYYCSPIIKKYCFENASGSTFLEISKKKFEKCLLPIANIEEQKKIAKILSDIDKKIESQATLVEKLKNTKDAMFVKMFPQGDNVNPTLRFKKEDGSNYADWGKEKLNKIASPKARIGWQGMRQSEFLDFGDYYLITGTDFDNGSINFDTCCYVEKYRYDQDKNIQVHNGDILITKDGTLGKVAYISNMDKPATLNAGVFVLNNLDEKMDSLFLYHYLAAPFLMEYANQQATGGTIKHLNQKVLVSFEIPIPDKEEQIKIGKCLSNLDKEIEINQQKYEKLCDVKKALLSKLFPTKEDE